MSKLSWTVAWLAEFLGPEPRPAREVASAAAEAGISQATLRRAAGAGGVVKQLVGERGTPGQVWVWSMRASRPESEHLEATHTAASDRADESVGVEPLEVLAGWCSRVVTGGGRARPRCSGGTPRRCWRVTRRRGGSGSVGPAGIPRRAMPLDTSWRRSSAGWSRGEARVSFVPLTVIRRP